jgi:hypothetical protein
MPTTFYALSYKDTGSILSYCMLEKQTFIDQSAVDALRDAIVGDNLVISLSMPGGNPIKIPKSEVSLDEVKVEQQDLTTFTRQPYTYVLAIPNDGSTKPGDGKLKHIMIPDDVVIALSEQPSGQPSRLTVSIAPSNSPENRPLFALLPGQSPGTGMLATSQQSSAASLIAKVTKDTVYPVIFIGHNLRTKVGLLKAIA